MKQKIAGHVLLASLGLAFTMGSSNVWAQAAANYPDKPVKVIIPFPPGGTLDKIGRMLALKVGEQLGQNFVVENRPGGNGIIGADVVAKANADGYTLLFNASTFVTAPMTMKSVPYKVQTDFTPIAFVASAPLSIAVSNKLGVSDVKGLAATAKANPGKLSYGSPGIGTFQHLVAETIKNRTGTFMLHIPYRGGGPMMTDMLGGTIKLMFINQDVALQHVKAGKLRALAVSSAQRNPLYPDVPTVAESGYKGFEALSWSGLSVPKGTPQAVVDKLEAAMSQAMLSPAIKQRMESNGFVVPAQGSKHYTEFVKSEEILWTKVIKTAGIKSQ